MEAFELRAYLSFSDAVPKAKLLVYPRLERQCELTGLQRYGHNLNIYEVETYVTEAYNSEFLFLFSKLGHDF